VTIGGSGRTLLDAADPVTQVVPRMADAHPLMVAVRRLRRATPTPRESAGQVCGDDPTFAGQRLDKLRG
jgi:hypothetical protein